MGIEGSASDEAAQFPSQSSMSRAWPPNSTARSGTSWSLQPDAFEENDESDSSDRIDSMEDHSGPKLFKRVTTDREELSFLLPDLRCRSRFDAALSPLMIPESNMVRKVWEFMLLFVLLYVGIVFPYQLAFIDFRLRDCDSAEAAGDEDKDVAYYIDWILFVFFWVDLVVNFIFTYRKENTEIFSPSRILWHYLTGFFGLNLLACLPDDVFRPLILALEINPGACDGLESSGTNSGHESVRLLRLQRVTRLARLARLLRLFKIASFLKKSVGLWLMNFLRSFRILNWLAGLLWVMHLLACGWYLCAAMHSDHSNTWVARRGIPTRDPLPERTLMDEPAEVQWVHAMYFILTVFSTVGFGDMSAYTTGEIVYVCIVMIVGAVAHGIVIGEVINLISEENEDTRWRKNQSNLLKAFSNHANFPPEMTGKITDWIENLEHGRPAIYDREEMRQLIVSGLLPRRLLGEMQENLFRGLLVQNRFLKICSSGLRTPNAVMPPRFALMLGTFASCMLFKKDELVFQMYDHAFNLYLAMSGTFACVAEPGPDGGTDVMCDIGNKDCRIGNKDSRSRVTATTKLGGMRRSLTGSISNAGRKQLVHVDGVSEENQCDRVPTEFKLENPDERDRICSTKSAHHISSALDAPHSAWTPAVYDGSQWIRVDLCRLKPVCGIIIQGHPVRRKEYVKEVQVEVSKDGDTWEMVSDSFVMDGVEDGQTENRMTFAPHRARYVRVVPLDWNQAPSMRMGILVSAPKLYPYKLFGRLNFFGDEVLLNGQRACTMRCMQDGEVLVLHKQDLVENGGGVEIFKEFPQFQGVLRHSLYHRQQRRLIMLSRLTQRQTVYNFAASCIQGYWKELYKAKKRAQRREATTRSLGNRSNGSQRRTKDSNGSIVPPLQDAKPQGNFAKHQCDTESLGEAEMPDQQDQISHERDQITKVSVSPVHGHVAFQEDQPSSEGQPSSRGGSSVNLKYQRSAVASAAGRGSLLPGNVEAKAKDEQARLERQMQVLARDVSSLRSELTGKIDRLTALLERQSMSTR